FSTIITAEHKENYYLIDPSVHDSQHGFKLILRGRNNRFKRGEFYKNINNSIIVLKRENTGEILGRFNPLPWMKIMGKIKKFMPALFFH
ncbi:21992_t:CDS:1, partial [Gigaspora rosea]